MTSATEKEDEIKTQRQYSRCKTFTDYRDLVLQETNERCIGFEEALERIESAKDAFSLAWAIGRKEEGSAVEALNRFFDLAVLDDEGNQDNSFTHCVAWDDQNFFYELVFSDAKLIRRAAEFFGTSLD